MPFMPFMRVKYNMLEPLFFFNVNRQTVAVSGCQWLRRPWNKQLWPRARWTCTVHLGEAPASNAALSPTWWVLTGEIVGGIDLHLLI
jgi:hypothetical protein